VERQPFPLYSLSPSWSFDIALRISLFIHLFIYLFAHECSFLSVVILEQNKYTNKYINLLFVPRFKKSDIRVYILPLIYINLYSSG